MRYVLVVALFAAVLVLPGLAIGVAAGLRRWTAMAASPAISYGLITITGELCDLMGFRLGLLPLLITTATAICVIIACRQLTAHRLGATNASAGNEIGRPEGHHRANDRWIISGILLGTTIGAATVLTAMGSLEAVTQGRDSIWHVNLIRFIIESGDASPTSVAEVRGFDRFYYPNVYHAGVALVGMITHSSIMALTGAHLMLVAGVTGLGLAGLLRKFTHRTALAAAVPVVAAMSYLFPYHLMAWGPLWTFLTGIALVPGFVLLVSEALDRGPRAGAVLVVTGIAAAGVLGVHTSAALTAAIFLGCLVAARWRTDRAVLPADLLVIAGVGLACALAAPVHVGATLGLGRVATEANVDFPAIGSPGVALGHLLFDKTVFAHPPYWLLGLMLIGVLGWRRLRSMVWWFAASAVFLGLYIAAASYDSPLTEALTILWWNDYLRLGGIVSLALIILAACGLVTLTDTIGGAARRRIPALAKAPQRHLFAAAGLTVALGLGIATGGFYLPVNGSSLNTVYRDAPLISVGEQEAMRELADMVGPGDRVMNDPNDGSPWMWALVNVRPMFAYTVRDISNPSFTTDSSLLLRSFRCLDSDPTVRAAIEGNNITHVFLGQGFIASHFNRVEGLRNIRGSDSVTLVYDQDGIEIYEIELTQLEPPLADCAVQSR